MKHLLTLQCSRPTPSLGVVRVSVPSVHKGLSKGWPIRMIRIQRLGVLETSQGRVDRFMTICRPEGKMRSTETVTLRSRMDPCTTDYLERELLYHATRNIITHLLSLSPGVMMTPRIVWAFSSTGKCRITELALPIEDRGRLRLPVKSQRARST